MQSYQNPRTSAQLIALCSFLALLLQAISASSELIVMRDFLQRAVGFAPASALILAALLTLALEAPLRILVTYRARTSLLTTLPPHVRDQARSVTYAIRFILILSVSFSGLLLLTYLHHARTSALQRTTAEALENHRRTDSLAQAAYALQRAAYLRDSIHADQTLQLQHTRAQARQDSLQREIDYYRQRSSTRYAYLIQKLQRKIHATKSQYLNLRAQTLAQLGTPPSPPPLTNTPTPDTPALPLATYALAAILSLISGTSILAFVRIIHFAEVERHLAGHPETFPLIGQSLRLLLRQLTTPWQLYLTKQHARLDARLQSNSTKSTTSTTPSTTLKSPTPITRLDSSTTPSTTDSPTPSTTSPTPKVQPLDLKSNHIHKPLKVNGCTSTTPSTTASTTPSPTAKSTTSTTSTTPSTTASTTPKSTTGTTPKSTIPPTTEPSEIILWNNTPITRKQACNYRSARKAKYAAALKKVKTADDPAQRDQYLDQANRMRQQYRQLSTLLGLPDNL